MPQNLLIIGATGVIGKPITREIINAKNSFGRIAILTSENTIKNKPSEIDGLKKSGIEILNGDITKEDDMKKAYHGLSILCHLPNQVSNMSSGIHTVVSCVGRNVIAQQIPLIKWAAETSVTRFFPSEYGTDIEYSPKSASEKPHQQKLKVRQCMATVKNLEWTYLVTGPYSDLYFGPAYGGFDVKAKKAQLLGDGKGRVSFTTMAEYESPRVSRLRY